MFNIIPLILILLALMIIIIIIGRKFSVLANLDIDTIPAEREAKVKEQIIGNRLKRNYYKYQARLSRIFVPLFAGIGEIFKEGYRKILDFKDDYKKEKFEGRSLSAESETDKLFVEIEEHLKNEDYAAAESLYIKIISQDSKSVKAFRGLGDLYLEQKNYQESKQTIEHAIRLLEKEQEELASLVGEAGGEEKQARLDAINKQLSELFYDIALCSRYLEDLPDSLSSIGKALAIEPNNPRFLDTKLDLSIQVKDQALARETLEKMAQVNPENQKLPELQSKVEEIEGAQDPS